ncbi:uncharacterized protein A4U43_C07F36410 [Asparagus officinalis]|uniref:N-acetyltransferase domain-containing protein n=1 Tax=Asparagus officinalis TaxID=4686 RepID=A0A5P1EMV3_ASPOF|nr:uncharacterized protein LOC109850328 isoform X1 [Asparagus officinalis]ONK65370.1 uncharacterized protein A4U43_C07F36410 [Asparagus officinalis]
MTIAGALTSDLVQIPFAYSSIGRRQLRCPKYFVSPVMRDDSKIAASKKEKEGISERSDLRSEPARIGYPRKTSDLRFDRLQLSDDEVDCEYKRAFGRYIAREAILDEEFWTAAWLRAESHWEDKQGSRHVDTFKRQFAEQEFSAIKRRCTQQLAEKSTCIIVVKKDEPNMKRTVLSSIVGTLDINIRHLLCGETFPGERTKVPVPCTMFGRKDQPIYGYVANLSVVKYARRKGIASNMLLLAVDAAKSHGVNEVFVHVHTNNMAAQKLYEKLGFKMVEKAMPQSLEEDKFLMCLKTA